MACIGGIALGNLLEGCGVSKQISGNIQGSDLIIPLSEFEYIRNNQVQFRNYIIVQNNTLQYPICVYRFDEKNFAALWMRCPHQGAELQVFGDVLQCPAHGSEFDHKGRVLNAPASENLKTFTVHVQKNQIAISLK